MEMDRAQPFILLFLLVLVSCILASCVKWEDVGEGVAKGQGTVQVELSRQETALAQGVATAVQSYDEERERQGQPACAAALLPVLALGLVFAWRQSRGR
jgi:hypothetical protein